MTVSVNVLPSGETSTCVLAGALYGGFEPRISWPDASLRIVMTVPSATDGAKPRPAGPGPDSSFHVPTMRPSTCTTFCGWQSAKDQGNASTAIFHTTFPPGAP